MDDLIGASDNRRRTENFNEGSEKIDFGRSPDPVYIPEKIGKNLLQKDSLVGILAPSLGYPRNFKGETIKIDNKLNTRVHTISNLEVSPEPQIEVGNFTKTPHMVNNDALARGKSGNISQTKISPNKSARVTHFENVSFYQDSLEAEQKYYNCYDDETTVEKQCELPYKMYEESSMKYGNVEFQNGSKFVEEKFEQNLLVSAKATQTCPELCAQGGNKTKRVNIRHKRGNYRYFNDEQAKLLNEFYENNMYPTPQEYENLAKATNCQKIRIKRYFQNKRKASR